MPTRSGLSCNFTDLVLHRCSNFVTEHKIHQDSWLANVNFSAVMQRHLAVSLGRGLASCTSAALSREQVHASRELLQQNGCTFTVRTGRCRAWPYTGETNTKNAVLCRIVQRVHFDMLVFFLHQGRGTNQSHVVIIPLPSQFM